MNIHIYIVLHIKIMLYVEICICVSLLCEYIIHLLCEFIWKMFGRIGMKMSTVIIFKG